MSAGRASTRGGAAARDGRSAGGTSRRALAFELRLLRLGAPPLVLARTRIDAADAGRWRPLAADLAGLAGESARFEIAARPLGEAGVPSPASGGARDRAPTPVLGLPRLWARRPPRPRERNVVLISLDTLRADRLSCYGAPVATTPRIDALAAEGVRFGVALAPATSTPPSHMTLLTGVLPCRHGVFGVRPGDRLPATIPTLAEHLSDAGYATAAITEDAFVSAPLGFARGFDAFRERKGERPGAVTPTGLGPRTFREAGEWIRTHADRRFLLFVHSYQMHGPRRPPPPYRSLFPDEAEPALRPGDDAAFLSLRRYDQMLRQADDLVGDLVREIREAGLADETILVITSDHGEAFREHGDHGHGFSLYEEVTRVPLVFWAPGLGRPASPSTPVGLVDVTPTILELLGLPVPGGLDGRSLAAAIRGLGPPPAGRVFYLETAPGNAHAVRDERWAILRLKGGRELVFDLERDPREQRPLAEPPAAAREPLARLRAELARGIAACASVRRDAEARAKGRSPLDARRREKLRALGYTD